jgi:hypothetical protein
MSPEKEARSLLTGGGILNMGDVMDLVTGDMAEAIVPRPASGAALFLCSSCEREWTRADYSPENGMCDSCCERAAGCYR